MEKTNTEKKVIKILESVHHQKFNTKKAAIIENLRRCTHKDFLEEFDSILGFYGWIFGIEKNIKLNACYRLLKKELDFRENGVVFA